MKRSTLGLCILVMVTCLCIGGCDPSPTIPVSSSGVSKATVAVPTGSDGLTVEQRNVSDRLKEDNKPGAIKHLYIISAYSGQVLVYSTVRGKVSSGGKRLTPTALSGDTNDINMNDGTMRVVIGPHTFRTNEVIQDDGTYGSSMDYLYWWDTRGIYHQHYVSGGQIVHVSSQPLSVKSVLINMAMEP